MAQGWDQRGSALAHGADAENLAASVINELKNMGVLPPTAKPRNGENVWEALTRLDINPHEIKTGVNDPNVMTIVHDVVHNLSSNMRTINPPMDPAPMYTAKPESVGNPGYPQVPSQQSAEKPVEGMRMLTQSDDVELVQTWCSMPVQLDQSYKGLPAHTLARFTMPVTVADVVNAKGEVYPKSIWDANMPPLKQMAQSKRLLGSNDHPTNPGAALGFGSMLFSDLYWAPSRRQDQGWEMFGQGYIADTCAGRDLMTWLDLGVPVDVSSRGMGRTDWSSWGGGRYQVVQNYVCKGFDAVLGGASPGAGFSAGQLEQSAEGAPSGIQVFSIKLKPMLRMRTR